MPVYFARFGVLGPVKIGHSLSVYRRIEAIQARLWDELKLIRLLEGTQDDERVLHRRFADLRIKYEWFHYSPDMMGDLGLPNVCTDPPRMRTKFHISPEGSLPRARSYTLGTWMVRQGLSDHELATLLGVTRSSVSGWLRYGYRPRAEVVLRLIKIGGVELEAIFKLRDPLYRGGKLVVPRAVNSPANVNTAPRIAA